MNIGQLRCFQAVSEQLNFTRAAEALYMTQTTLSYQIASLEKELGVKLFVRKHSGIELTPSGAVLKRMAPEVLMSVENAVSETVKAAKGGSSVLRLGFLGLHEQQFLPALVKKFSSDYPSVEVVMKQGTPEGMRDQLCREMLDLVFSVYVGEVRAPEIAFVEIAKMPLYAIMRADHPLATWDHLTRRDIAGEDLYCIDAEAGIMLHNHFRRSFDDLGISYRIADTASSMESLPLILEAKNGISIMPGCFVPRDGGLVGIPIKGGDEFVSHILAWRKADENPVIPLFVNMTREIVDQLQERERKTYEGCKDD